MARAVLSETMAGVLPSASSTLPPKPHRMAQNVVLASPVWLMAMPTGVPCFLRTLPALSSSSHVRGGSWAALRNCAMLYEAGNDTQYHGTAFQPEAVCADSAAKGYQPPYCLPRESTRPPTSTSWFSNRYGSA